MMRDKFGDLISVGDYCLRIDDDRIYLIYILNISDTGYKFIYKEHGSPIKLNSRPSTGRGYFHKGSNSFITSKILIKIEDNNPLFDKF